MFLCVCVVGRRHEGEFLCVCVGGGGHEAECLFVYIYEAGGVDDVPKSEVCNTMVKLYWCRSVCVSNLCL